jgi:hypothetical protein
MTQVSSMVMGACVLLSMTSATVTGRNAFSLVVVVDGLVLCVDTRAQPVPAPSITVVLQVVQKDDVSGIAWTVMANEARVIWAREGVELTWDAADTTTTLRLPVSFDDRTLRKYDKKPSAALGMTIFDGRSQQILISVPRARRLARAAAREVTDGALGRDVVLGRLLGRVLAHEIGHALLLTKRHSASGLMSGNIMPRELPPFNDDPLALSVRDRERLATRFSNSPERARPSVMLDGGAAKTVWLAGTAAGIVSGGRAAVFPHGEPERRGHGAGVSRLHR